MTTRRFVRWVGFFVVGAICAGLASAALRYELEAPEVRAYCAGTYPCRVVPGKPLFTTAVSQGYADAVVDELKQKIEREGVTSAYPISSLFTGLLLSFLDPVKLLLTAVFAGLAAVVSFYAGL
jgi:hypothetical protein